MILRLCVLGTLVTTTLAVATVGISNIRFTSGNNGYNIVTITVTNTVPNEVYYTQWSTNVTFSTNETVVDIKPAFTSPVGGTVTNSYIIDSGENPVFIRVLDIGQLP